VRTVVIGVGNDFRRDDGAGLAVAGRLRGRVPGGVSVVECEQEPSRLLDAWSGADRAFVVDACSGGGPAGTVHRFWNAGDIDARFVCQVAPALQFEALIETMFGLAADGKTNRKGIPNPVRLAVIADAHWDGLRAPYVPSMLQRVGLTMGAAVGRAIGYSAQYEASQPVTVGGVATQGA